MFKLLTSAFTSLALFSMLLGPAYLHADDKPYNSKLEAYEPAFPFFQPAAPGTPNVNAGQVEPEPSGSQSQYVTCTTTLGSLSSATVQAAINSAAANDVICLPAGSANWSSINFSNSKGATLAGRAAIEGATGTTTINANAIGMNTTCLGDLSHRYRITGITFSGGGNQIWFNAYNGGSTGCTLRNLRIDHNIFTGQAANSRILYFGDNQHNAYFYGVVDHNTILNSSSVVFAEFVNSTGANAPADSRGGVNNLFFENNTMTITTQTNDGAGCIDSTGSPSVVWRYNTTTNCLLTAHGVTHGGGIVNYEIYGNTFILNSNAHVDRRGCARAFHHQGSGETIGFNNTFTCANTYTGGAFAMTHYRSNSGGASGFCDGTQPQDGNRTPLADNRGYNCRRQPGRDINGVLQPMYVWNNTANGSIVTMNIECCLWAGTDYMSIHIQANRDYFNAVNINANTSKTSPFNGTTGMGFGLFQNRPDTCSTGGTQAADAGNGGVGYFATDIGAQGTLYRCATTDNWVVHYTPYTYPFPWP